MTPEPRGTAAEDGGAAVVLEGVGVRFGGAAAPWALRDVTLRVRRGERVALLGPSGAGKSTLLGLLNATRRPTSGAVQVLGTDLDALSGPALRRLRARVGTLPQSLDLVGPLRVVHNVNAGRLASWSLLRSAWSLVRPQGLAEVEAALARVGLAHRVFDRCEDLSGGEQQRVALARVLVQQPQLVLADEPVASLDPALAAHVLDVLTSSRDRQTLITSLHDPDLARRSCDRLVGLREGQVLFDVRAEDLDRRLLQDLYGGRVPAR